MNTTTSIPSEKTHIELPVRAYGNSRDRHLTRTIRLTRSAQGFTLYLGIGIEGDPAVTAVKLDIEDVRALALALGEQFEELIANQQTFVERAKEQLERGEATRATLREQRSQLEAAGEQDIAGDLAGEPDELEL